MSQRASPCERCFVHADIQLFRIPRELWSKVSTVVVVNKQIPLDRYRVWGMYSHLTRLMQRVKWIIHVILAISFLAQHEHLHVTVIWWSVLNDSVIFPEKTMRSFSPQTNPSQFAGQKRDETSQGTLQPPGYKEIHGIRWDASRSAEGAGWHHFKASINFLKS